MTKRLNEGVLVVIEGIDGSGKSTQARRLAGHLRSHGLDVVQTREPTDGPHGKRIRESMTAGRLSPQDELDAFVADRKQHVEEVIRPALDAGKVVVIDRYYFSTAAYQGARGLDFDEIIATNERFAPRPDLLVLLDVPADVGVGRVHTRGDAPNLFEAKEYLEKVAALFARIEVGDAVVRIDGGQTEDAVQRQILRKLEPILRAKSGGDQQALIVTLMGGLG